MRARRIDPLLRAGLLTVAGLLLLGIGGLTASWQLVDLPLGMISLAAGVMALLWPEDRDTVANEAGPDRLRNDCLSLTQASLLTLAGFHLLA